jgi:hypothetical protein
MSGCQAGYAKHMDIVLNGLLCRFGRGLEKGADVDVKPISA